MIARCKLSEDEEKNSLGHDSLYLNITKQDELDFEYFIQHKPCLHCGEDHRFKPSMDGVQANIDHASELIALFFLVGDQV